MTAPELDLDELEASLSYSYLTASDSRLLIGALKSTLLNLRAAEARVKELEAACSAAHWHITSPDAVDDEGNYDPSETKRTIQKLAQALGKPW